MSFAGTIQNGVVVFDNQQHLPDGTRVEVIVAQRTPEQEAHIDRVYKILSQRYDGGERDIAARHDEHQP